jgi:hypothetical protein
MWNWREHVSIDKRSREYWRFPWIRWKSGVELQPVRYSFRGGNKVFEALILLPKDESTAEVYYPLEEHRGIWHEFSKLKEIADAKTFADQYGMLEGGPAFPRDMYLDLIPREVLRIQWPENRSIQSGEFAKSWLNFALEIREVWEIWQALEARNIRQLRKIITWNNGSVAARSSGGRCIPIADRSTNPIWLDRWRPGDLFGPAKLYIADRYNQRMERMASPAILLDSTGAFSSHSVPVSLLSAIWLELGEVITNLRRQIRCEICGRMMDVTDNRSNKRVHEECSKSRRMKKYRKELREKGTLIGGKETRSG